MEKNIYLYLYINIYRYIYRKRRPKKKVSKHRIEYSVPYIDYMDVIKMRGLF